MHRSLPLFALLTACAGGGVNNEADAELAYTGLDPMIGKAIVLGFEGFNTASSANIDDQSTDGDISGTLVVSGQVDQGNSDNKGMRLSIALDEYADEVLLDDDEDELSVTYWTDADVGLPDLDIQLKDFPDGTLEGTLDGTFTMEGDLTGDVTLALTLAGATQAGAGETVERVEGGTTITGTATSDYGEYAVDITL